MNFISANLWKIATGGAAIVALLLSALLLSSYFDNKSLSRQRTELSKSINDPATGYIAQLSQARTNVATLTDKVKVQNEAIDRLSKESAARLAETKRQLAIAQSETRLLERKLVGYLATKPQGATLEDRVRDIDRRALEEFLP